MDAFFDNAPEILAAASKSLLGMIGLMVFALTIISIILFHSATAKIKVVIFILLLISLSVFAYSVLQMMKQKNMPQATEPLDNSKSSNPNIQKQCIIDNPSIECLWTKQAWK